MVKISYVICMTVFLVFQSSSGFAQINKEFNFILERNPIIKSAEKVHSAFSFKQNSESKLFIMVMIRLYQNFISSQQDNLRVCIFTPSCSRFGMAAIQKYGLFYGTLMAVDRIHRCHNYGKKSYPIHPQTGKYSDPVELYYLRTHSK